MNWKHTKQSKRKGLAMFGASLILTGALAAGSTAFAGSGVKSRGSLVLEGGDMALYASDIQMLQSDVEALFREASEPDAAASGGKVRRSEIKSKGILNYADSAVVINAADLTYLAGEIDELERTCKQNMLWALNDIHTYFDADGGITHEECVTDDPATLTFLQLRDGILNSQTVTTDTTVDNLSEGKAAWVNGVYITGNGNDVNAAYVRGYKEGVDHTIENARIDYVYHKHIKGDGTESDGVIYGYDAPGGCYVSGGHTHNATENCPITEYPTITKYMYCGSFHYRDEDDNGNPYYICDACGITANAYGSNDGVNKDGEHYKTEEVTDYDHPVYGCASSANTWVLGCNKTPSTIESATITFYE